MKHLKYMKKWLKILLLVLIVGAVYRDSFTSAFFQDDKILLGLANTGNPFRIIANFPYRPISQEIFYRLNYLAFGLNPTGYHLALFAFFVGSLVLIYKLSRSFLAVFFYALNISLFANFYWIATSYFTIGAFFFFLTQYFYVRKKALLTTITFILAMGSNEIAFVLPIVFLAINWLENSWPKWFWGFVISLPILFWLRILIGLPQAQDYTLAVSGSAISTFRWYLIRVLNLPEGIQRISTPIIFGLFGVVVAVLGFSLIRYLLTKDKNIKLLLFGGVYFVLATLPFFFLPNHMSAYYLTISLFGPALIVGEVVKGKKLVTIFCVCYLLLTILGLEFLSQTHWIIRKNTGPIGKF